MELVESAVAEIANPGRGFSESSICQVLAKRGALHAADGTFLGAWQI